MATWRSLGVLVMALAAAPYAAAQSYPLQEATQAGDCFSNRLEMKLSGAQHLNRDGEKITNPLSASTTHIFDERVLVAGPNGWPIKSARHYDTARIAIAVGTKKSERTLRAERRLIVAQRCKEQFLCYCADGPLTREELDLASEHLDTQPLAGLLPGKAVAVGETWKLTNPVAQAICAFEGLISQDLTGKLESVNGDVAVITVTGGASGIELGGMVKLTVQASGKFDLKQKRIVALEWKQKDEREQGPASPATVVETTRTLTRSCLEETPKELSDASLVAIPDGDEPPAAHFLQLYGQEPGGQYTLVYPREWQMVAQTEQHVILRLVERGDFIAQVVVTPWDKADAGKHLSGKEFKEVMDNEAGWEAQEVRECSELPSGKDGYWTYRISALGLQDGLKVMKNYYLVAGPHGDQVVLNFTMRQAMADKLGTRDIMLVAGVNFPAPAKDEKK